MSDLVFYTNPMSRGRIVRWMLEELGEPYETRIIAYGPEMKSPDYLAVNPMGKVPAIVHRGAVITETPAICTYLADAFPEKGLAPPPGGPGRAAFLRWIFYAAGPLEQAVVNGALGVVVPEERKGMAGYGSMADVMAALEPFVSAASPWLLGERFSALDVYLGSQIGWGVQFGTIEKRPAFEAYVARIMARPASVKAREIDDALLPPAAPQTA